MRLCDDGTSVDDWGESSPRVSFPALPRTHTLGQEGAVGQGLSNVGNPALTGPSPNQVGRQHPLLSLNFTKLGWPVLLPLRPFAMQ